MRFFSCAANEDNIRQLFVQAGATGPLMEVMKTHLQSAAVVEQACRALSNVVYNGKKTQ